MAWLRLDNKISAPQSTFPTFGPLSLSLVAKHVHASAALQNRLMLGVFRQHLFSQADEMRHWGCAGKYGGWRAEGKAIPLGLHLLHIKHG